MKKRLIVLLFLINSACTQTTVEDSAPENVPTYVSEVKDAIPKYEERTRAGNPGEYEVFGKKYQVLSESAGYKEKGIASWYGTKFHGRKTANGEVYNMYGMTAAHKTLPIPSYVRVTNLKNKRSVVVRINDRGPFHDNRLIDLSYAAAIKLGIQQTGTGPVEVLALGFDSAEQIEQKIVQLSEDKQHTVFYLQVGAFSSSENATQLQGKLSHAAIDAIRIQHAKKGNNQLYKVQVGPLHSEQQAKQENEKLAQIGISNAVLVIEKN